MKLKYTVMKLKLLLLTLFISINLAYSQDTDGDGVLDSADLDDDNDGILDNNEMVNVNFDINGGNSITINNLPNVGASSELVVDFFSLDNSFNITFKGQSLNASFPEIQYQVRSAPSNSNFMRFTSDNCSYRQCGIKQIYAINGAEPLIRVIIDGDGNVQFFGRRVPSSALEPMSPDEGVGQFSWSSVNTIVIGQAKTGPTNATGIINAFVDTDSDGMPNYLDLDSDGDSCSDANEYYNNPSADGGDGGEFGQGMPSVDLDGLVIAAGYNGTDLPNVTDDAVSLGCDPYIYGITGNWQTDANWNFGRVPTALDTAIVRANVSVITIQELSNLTVDPTFSVDVANGFSLNITGDINNAGILSGEGEVVLTGTSAQSISGGGSFENLRLNNSTSVDFTDPADLFGVVYVDQGILNTNGNLSLRCNFGTPGKTAQVGPVVGTIVGDVTVEQCYPARRAFRFLSPSVTTATSIRENWQENPVGYLDNPRLGYGTHITGVEPGSANATVDQDGNNGFDYNPSGNASMFTFDNSTPSWDRVTNANGVLTAGEAYRLFLGEIGVSTLHLMSHLQRLLVYQQLEFWL
jgi:hypothetical protein